jgi:6-phosphofructokinase
MQQGGMTSPFDRNLGTELGARATYWLVQKVTKTDNFNMNSQNLDMK